MSGRFRIAVGKQSHRTLQVCKQHSIMLALAFERTAGSENLLCKIGWGVGEWRLSKALHRGRGGGGSGASITRPDEAAPRIVVDLRMGVEKLVFEIVEGVLIQGKLSLEGAIGYPAAPLQHGYS